MFWTYPDDDDLQKPGRRCSICSINWPNLDLYQRCPKCDRVTSYMSNLTNVLSAETAKAQASHYRFEKFLENEDPEKRVERVRKGEEEFEAAEARLAEARVISAKFDAVIAGAGYSKAEREEIERLETILRGRETRHNGQIESD